MNEADYREVADVYARKAHRAGEVGWDRARDLARYALTAASVVRGVGLDDVLGAVGLARKRGWFSRLPFGAGLVVGAGLGVLFAPASGADTRKALRARLGAMFGTAAKAPEPGVDAPAPTDGAAAAPAYHQGGNGEHRPAEPVRG